MLAFFKQIDATVPRGLSIHVILDNLSAHKTPDVRKWLAHKDRRRWHLHFTPTSSSWLNLIERWFKELTDKRLRRGVFTSPLGEPVPPPTHRVRINPKAAGDLLVRHSVRGPQQRLRLHHLPVRQHRRPRDPREFIALVSLLTPTCAASVRVVQCVAPPGGCPVNVSSTTRATVSAGNQDFRPRPLAIVPTPPMPPSPTSPRRSLPGPSTGTPTPNHSSGKQPSKTSSTRSPEDAKPSTRSNQRRSTSRRYLLMVAPVSSHTFPVQVTGTLT